MHLIFLNPIEIPWVENVDELTSRIYELRYLRLVLYTADLRNLLPFFEHFLQGV